MKILRTLLLSAALCGVATLCAKPALKTPFIVTQPDGTQLTIKKVGDEFYHYYLTDDDKVVLRSGDAYFFAAPGASGRLEPSKFLASDVEFRTPEQRAFLASVTPEAINSAINVSRLASPRFVSRELELNMTSPYNVGPMREATENPSAGIGTMAGKNFPRTGDVRGLVILVEYPDKPFLYDDETTYQYFYNMLNQPGFSEENAKGSAWDYFNQASMGVFNPTFDVLGPVTLPENRAYYGGNDNWGNDMHPSDMVLHAADILAEQGVDFSIYDNDGDGTVDNVFIFYSGEGEASSNVAESVWPHQYTMSQALNNRNGYKVGDVYINSYACGSEIYSTGTMRDGIGTFCHEFSHVFGLPDLYDTAYSGDYTPGPYSVLDQGPYNGDGRVPPTYSTFERNALNWIDLIVIDRPMNITLPNLLTSNVGYIVLGNKPEEFFLLENRQRISGTWDRELPGHGMLIWHIEYNAQRWTKNIVNTIATRQYVDLIEANGAYGSTSAILKRYPFPGTSKVTSFDGFKTQAGAYLGYPLTEISEVLYGDITFKVAGGESGIQGIVSDAGLRISGREISAEQPFDVYDLAGRIIAKGQKAASLPASGVYFISIGGNMSKIAVK